MWRDAGRTDKSVEFWLDAKRLGRSGGTPRDGTTRRDGLVDE